MDGRTEESSESPVCVCVCFPSPDFKLIALLFFWISPELISPWDEWQESGESTIGAQTDLCSCLHWTHMNWREPPSRWTSALCVCVCVLKRRNSNGETPPHRTALDNQEKNQLCSSLFSDSWREDADVGPHEGPQRRPSTTIGHAGVSWMYVSPVSWLDWLELIV